MNRPLKQPLYFIVFCVISFQFLVLPFLSGCSLQKISIPSEEKGQQRATSSLLEDAENALFTGNVSKAEELYERAIRIEPQNPLVWQGLAKSKFQQGLFPQAIQMSLKSNSYTSSHSLKRDNWLIIEKAYLEMGDVERAEKARANAGI